VFDFVQIAHVVQQTLNGENLPTISFALPYFEMFLTAWESLSHKHPHLKPWIDVGIEWAKTYYERMDLTRAYVVSMGKQIFYLETELFLILSSVTMLVLNPSVRMSWIQNNWDEAYIKRAETIFKELVSCYLNILFTNCYYQMISYRARKQQEMDNTGTAAPTPQTKKFYGCMDLGLKYGLEDMVIGGSDGPEQTVEQEYLAFVTSPLTPEGSINMLDYYAVSFNFCLTEPITNVIFR
jgi:hypothetical protein